MKKNFTLLTAVRAVCLAVVLTVVAAPAAEEENWLKHFRVGGTIALNIKAKFKTEGAFVVPGNAAGSPGTGGTHIYDDGYVRPDQGSDPNYTSYWGYNNASQNDPPGSDVLLFHSVNSFTTTGSSGEETDWAAGLDVAYGADLGRWGNIWYGWEVGFNFLPAKITEKSGAPATFTRTVHEYNTGGILLPEPPYAGGNSGVGPNLPNTATEVPGGDTIDGTLNSSRTLRASIYSLRLGPTVLWEFGRYVALSVNGGPAIAYVTAEYESKDTVTTTDGGRTQISESFDDDKFLFGGGVGVTLMFHTVESADIYIGAQFMTLGDMSLSRGGRKAELDLSAGIYLSAGVNWPF
jgi:hypothetical protein